MPVAMLLLMAAALIAYWQLGYVPRGTAGYPRAGVSAEWWELAWLGLWTGWLMALIGGAAGLLALPYCVSVLGFTDMSITPTMLLLTMFNPIGALFGFRTDGLFNRRLALLFCASAAIGGFAGPFVRVGLLSDIRAFAAAVGLVLVAAGLGLARSAGAERRSRHGGQVEDGGGRIRSLPSQFGKLRVTYDEAIWSFDIGSTFLAGAVIGAVSSMLGFGGGFLLVPLLSLIYRMPMRLLVAASIPYVMTLSGAGLFAYSVVLPGLGGANLQPEWSFGLFIAAGGVVGSWFGAKTQRFVSERPLQLFLGLVCGVLGLVFLGRAFLDTF